MKNKLMFKKIEKKLDKKNKKGQVTIFVILAIVIVAGIVIYFAVREGIGKQEIPKELSPVYNYFLSCVEDQTQQAALIAGSQGGYIEIPEFEAGSNYMPFSSQLNFLGTPVPYWYYVSGNGIVKEQIPTKAEIEQQLEDYLSERFSLCSSGFEEFEEQGFEINFEDFNEINDINVEVKENQIDVTFEMPLSISFGEISSSINRHEKKVSSRFGKFYNLARKIYEKEQDDLFLEEYGVDVLRLYAPVDGVEITCAPKIWIQEEIKEELKRALEGNVQAIKLRGDYYSLSQPENKYFVRDVDEQIGARGENVNFLYSGNWPTKIEVYPNENPLIAKPIGMQQGLGVLGFCYVPYHFVYDMAYPVLIQIYDAEEMFQFPLAVVIQGNQPREALKGTSVRDAEPELCKYKNQEIEVYTYNIDLEPVEADIDFKCLGQRCDVGKTKITDGDSKLHTLFPACYNGFIIAKAENHANKKYKISTNVGENSKTVDIVLDKLYDLDVELQVNNKITDDYAIISFVSEEHTQNLAWPSQKRVELSEGYYNVSVYVYRNSSIRIPGMQKEYCSEVPKSGILGVLGMTEERCFDVDLPSQQLSNVISGGGKGTDYLTADRLEKGKLKIKVQGIPLPDSLEDLQDSYNLIEVQSAYLEFEEK